MQGPVEVDGVRHRFDAQMGFYSQVEPKLTTYMRGADEGMDTQWMSSAASVGYVMGWVNRGASFVGKTFGLGARGAMYASIGAGLKRIGAGMFGSGVSA